MYQIPKGILGLKMLRTRALDRGFLPETLNPSFSECDPRTSSMGIAWKFLEKAKISGSIPHLLDKNPNFWPKFICFFK